MGAKVLNVELKKLSFSAIAGALSMWLLAGLWHKVVMVQFSLMKTQAPTGSILVFDYFYQDFIYGNYDYYGAKEIAAAVK